MIANNWIGYLILTTLKYISIKLITWQYANVGNLSTAFVSLCVMKLSRIKRKWSFDFIYIYIYIYMREGIHWLQE